MAAAPAARKTKPLKTRDGPVGNRPCIVGDLEEVKSGEATVTTTGLMAADLHDVDGKQMSPLEYIKHLTREQKKAARQAEVAAARAQGLPTPPSER